MEQTSLKIEGMTCHHCVHAVQNRLSKMPGVKVNEVTIGAAKIERDPQLASMAAIAEAIADEGYTLST